MYSTGLGNVPPAAPQNSFGFSDGLGVWWRHPLGPLGVPSTIVSALQLGANPAYMAGLMAPAVLLVALLLGSGSDAGRRWRR